MMRGLSQEELARRSGVAVKTIYRGELGAPMRTGTFAKICKALDSTMEQLKVGTLQSVSGNVKFGFHPADREFWIYSRATRRTNTPDDELERIQNPEERKRLGLTGLVPTFGTVMDFIMPQGPGLLKIELYGKFMERLNDAIYREGIFMPIQGRVRIGILEDVVELGPGDMMGYHTKDLQFIEPAPEMRPEDLPVVIHWVGGVRIGAIPTIGKGERVSQRRRRLSEAED